MEECPVCGEEFPFSATECPSCGYEAEQFFLAEQVMTSSVRKRTFEAPPGVPKPGATRIMTEPARRKHGLHMHLRARDNGKNGNGRLAPGTAAWK